LVTYSISLIISSNDAFPLFTKKLQCLSEIQASPKHWFNETESFISSQTFFFVCVIGFLKVLPLVFILVGWVSSFWAFKGIKSKSIDIKNETNKLKAQKELTQPTKIKTSGSTFKNPITQTKKKVWELIKDSVSLNQCFGDACISDKHCNFFVNKGNASFEDMIRLIEYVTKKVKEKTGVNLEKEIKILE
jgi:hypothetical protein